MVVHLWYGTREHWNVLPTLVSHKTFSASQFRLCSHALLSFFTKQNVFITARARARATKATSRGMHSLNFNYVLQGKLMLLLLTCIICIMVRIF